MPSAPAILREPDRALARHRAGQETGSHRRINDHPNSLTQAVGQKFVFDLAMYQRIPRLQRSNWSNGLGALQLLDIAVGESNPTYLAFALQVGEREPSLFQRGGVWIRRPVDLVKIDYVDGKAAKTVLDFAAD